jgi:hypothetical protein
MLRAQVFKWNMSFFMTAWLPNLVCMVFGLVASGLIGFWQGKRVALNSEKHTRMLTNLLIVMEERGYLKLVRNEKGEVTGGRAYELAAEPGQVTLTGHPPTVTQAPPGQQT